MELSDLRVWHWQANRLRDLALLPQGGLWIETCQRQVWVSGVTPDTQAELGPSSAGAACAGEGLEQADFCLAGKQAYLFLLRFASGLESQVLGETDVFGQVKQAWQQVSQSGETWVSELRPWMTKIFEDSKEMRTLYLQGLGGASYGTLVKKYFKRLAQASEVVSLKPTVLLIGAGQLARSVAPYLQELGELWMVNRHQATLESWLRDDGLGEGGAQTPAASRGKGKRLKSQLIRVLAPEEEEAGWKSAQYIVLAVPPDPERDALRLAWLAARSPLDVHLLHLGVDRTQLGVWSGLDHCSSLSDLYELQKTTDSLRAVQLEEVGRACEQRARLRSLGGSLSMAHGWEDLALFQ